MAETATVLSGHDFTFAHATDFDTPVWDDFDNIESVNEDNNGDAQAVNRRLHGRKQYVHGAYDEGASIKCAHFDGDADRIAFENAYKNKTKLVICDFDDASDASGAAGTKRQVIVTNHKITRDHGVPVSHEFELKEAVGDKPVDITIV